MNLRQKYPHIAPEEDLMAYWETQWEKLTLQEKAEAAEFYRDAFHAVFMGDVPQFRQYVEHDFVEIPQA